MAPKGGRIDFMFLALSTYPTAGSATEDAADKNDDFNSKCGQDWTNVFRNLVLSTDPWIYGCLENTESS